MTFFSKEMNEIMGELILLKSVNKINDDKIEQLTNNNVDLRLKLVNLLKGLEMQNMNHFLDVAKPQDYLHFGQVYKSAVINKIKEGQENLGNMERR